MTINQLFIVAGISLLSCLASGASKSWNIFNISLIALFFSVVGLAFRVLP